MTVRSGHLLANSHEQLAGGLLCAQVLPLYLRPDFGTQSDVLNGLWPSRLAEPSERVCKFGNLEKGLEDVRVPGHVTGCGIPKKSLWDACKAEPTFAKCSIVSLDERTLSTCVLVLPSTPHPNPGNAPCCRRVMG